jgi:tetratricopeptide (TPR) repeat protein
MYLRTPKRYRPGRQRHLRLISGRVVLRLMLIVILAGAGWLIWQNRERVRSSVLPGLEELAIAVQTQVAPAPTPTATSDVMLAQVECLNSYRQGDLEKAIEQCTVLAHANPNDVGLHYQIAHALIITSNFGQNKARLQQALDFAERTINANPTAPDGWAIRARVLDWMGKYGEALASALHARALDETYAPTYAFLGEIYQDLGQYDTAQMYLERALELDTEGIAVADAFRNLGLLYSNQGRWEEALQPYLAALQRAPNQPYIAVELANNYIALGEIDQAIAVLSSIVERNPRDTTVLFSLGNAYTRNGDFDRAFEYYRRCLDVDPNNIPCLSYLGGLQWSDGDFVTAAVNLQRAIELGSQDPDDYYQLGHSQASLGRCDLAIPYLQQGYQIAVQREDARRQASFIAALQSCGVRTPAENAPGAEQ